MPREAYDDMGVMGERVAESGPDWTIVRPPKLTGKSHTGWIASSTNGNFTIGRADLADYLLGAAAGRLIRTAVSVAAAR